MSLEITSVYQLLDLARNRPGIYGIGGRSFTLLQAFLGGLSYAKLAPGDPPFHDFGGWVSIRTNHFPTSNPFHWLRDQSDEDAYETWFRLLDEYRTCRVVELARLPGTVVRFREHAHVMPDKSVQPYIPPTPQSIRIGRFAPSAVYFIEQVFSDRVAYKSLDEFQPSLERAIEEAHRAWQVPLKMWDIGRISGE